MANSLDEIFAISVALGKWPQEVIDNLEPKQITEFSNYLNTKSPGDAGTQKLLTDLVCTVCALAGNTDIHPADIAPWLHPGHKEMKEAVEQANRRMGVLAEVNSMIESGTLKIESRDG